MDYKFTFEDGSEALAHHGVKGMKWGVWNAETRAKYGSAGNGTYYRKAKRGSEYGKSVTDLRRAYNANQSKGKQIAKNILLTPGGAHAYNTSRSRGLSRSDSLMNASLGVLYAQGVKHKQKKLGTTKAMVSKAAKERGDYTRNESIKKSVGKTIIFGAPGSVAYNSVKARTKSRGKAAVAGVLTGAAAYGAALTAPVAGAAAGLGVGGSLGASVGANALSTAAGYGQYGINSVFRTGANKQQVRASSFKRQSPKTR